MKDIKVEGKNILEGVLMKLIRLIFVLITVATSIMDQKAL